MKNVISCVIFWILSVFSLLMAFGMFLGTEIFAGIILLAMALFVNPLVGSLLFSLFKFKCRAWMKIVAFFSCLIISFSILGVGRTLETDNTLDLPDDTTSSIAISTEPEITTTASIETATTTTAITPSTTSGTTVATPAPVSASASINKKESKENIVTNVPQNSNPLSVLKVYFLNVGQADSIFITDGTNSMIIDAGNSSDSDEIVNFITSQGIKNLNYVVGTHPHEDHIGGLTDVISKFTVNKIFMPKATTTTDTYYNLLTTIKNKGMKITAPNAGDSFAFGDSQLLCLNGGIVDSDELNDASIVLKLTHGKNSFIFTGDATVKNEEQMLSSGLDLKASILKVGHHGSETSSSEAFIKAVTPNTAIISVGANNSYGLPDDVILNRLSTFNCDVYRTDVDKTVLITSDGKSITLEKNLNVIQSNAPNTVSTTQQSTVVTTAASITTQAVSAGNQSQTVYVTKTGEKYHRGGCQYLRKSKIAISLADAKAQGYGPCSKCDPPQ